MPLNVPVEILNRIYWNVYRYNSVSNRIDFEIATKVYLFKIFRKRVEKVNNIVKKIRTNINVCFLNEFFKWYVENYYNKMWEYKRFNVKGNHEYFHQSRLVVKKEFMEDAMKICDYHNELKLARYDKSYMDRNEIKIMVYKNTLFEKRNQLYQAQCVIAVSDGLCCLGRVFITENKKIVKVLY